MSCDCIRTFEKTLTGIMVERNPGCEVVEEVTFQNKAWVLGEYGTMRVLSNPVLGRFRKGKTIRKFEAQIMPEYCPFCGKRLKEESGKEEGK